MAVADSGASSASRSAITSPMAAMLAGSSHTCGSVAPSSSECGLALLVRVRLAGEQGQAGGDVDGPVGGLLRHGLVDGGLEALDVEDEVGGGDLGDLGGGELEVVRLDAGRGEGRDGHGVAADLRGRRTRAGRRRPRPTRCRRRRAGEASPAVEAPPQALSSRAPAARDRGRARRRAGAGRHDPRVGLMKMIVKTKCGQGSEPSHELEDDDAEQGRDHQHPEHPRARASGPARTVR